MDENSSIPEFLTIEQLADRLHVSRATLFTWKQSAQLIQGRHYLQRGRVLRFVWSAELAQILFSAPSSSEGMVSPGRVTASALKRTKHDPVNWEY
jgi:hypothetical protein